MRIYNKLISRCRSLEKILSATSFAALTVAERQWFKRPKNCLKPTGDSSLRLVNRPTQGRATTRVCSFALVRAELLSQSATHLYRPKKRHSLLIFTSQQDLTPLAPGVFRQYRLTYQNLEGGAHCSELVYPTRQPN